LGRDSLNRPGDREGDAAILVVCVPVTYVSVVQKVLTGIL